MQSCLLLLIRPPLLAPILYLSLRSDPLTLWMHSYSHQEVESIPHLVKLGWRHDKLWPMEYGGNDSVPILSLDLGGLTYFSPSTPLQTLTASMRTSLACLLKDEWSYGRWPSSPGGGRPRSASSQKTCQQSIWMSPAEISLVWHRSPIYSQPTDRWEIIHGCCSNQLDLRMVCYAATLTEVDTFSTWAI